MTKITKFRNCCGFLDKAIEKFVQTYINPNDRLSLVDIPQDHYDDTISISNDTDKTIQTKYLLIGSFDYINPSENFLPGFNLCSQEHKLFISVGPHVGFEHIMRKQHPNLSAEEELEARKNYGQQYLLASLESIQRYKIPNDKIHIIVIGEENLITYQDYLSKENTILAPIYSSSDLQIKNYTFKILTKNSSHRIELHNIAGHSNELKINSQDLNYLYTIMSSSEPILIHCAQGLDRAGKFMLAFLIAFNIDKILSAKNSDDLADEIKDLWLSLRNVHSPQVLGNIVDFKQAIYLGFTLSLIHLQKTIAVQKQTITSSHRVFSFLKGKNSNNLESSSKNSLAVQVKKLSTELESVLFDLISPHPPKPSTDFLAR